MSTQRQYFESRQICSGDGEHQRGDQQAALHETEQLAEWAHAETFEGALIGEMGLDILGRKCFLRRLLAIVYVSRHCQATTAVGCGWCSIQHNY